MDLSIIIVNHNTKKLLLDCLVSVFSQTKDIDFEVLVVDNNSTDNSVELIKLLFINELTSSRIKIIKNKENLGFAKANNQGIEQAQGEYIILLNSDTKIIDQALVKLVRFAEKQPGLGVAGPRLVNADSSSQPSAAPFYTLPVTAVSLFKGDRWLRQSPAQARPVDWVSGACFLIKREVIEKIGFLDEKFFMYVEEMEYCYRAKKAGLTTFFYPGVEVVHLERGGQSGDWQRRQQAIWGIYQGLVYFYEKHFASWQLAVLKFLLRTKAALAWLVGDLTNNHYLKTTYAKAFTLAG